MLRQRVFPLDRTGATPGSISLYVDESSTGDRYEAITPTAVPSRIPIRISAPLPTTSSESVIAIATSIPTPP